MDVIIATAGSNIGMGGPAMVEGGGLGVFSPEQIGPLEVHLQNGVVDIAVADEAEAVRVSKHYLSFFQGTIDAWEAPDQRLMRRIVPENRLRMYDVRNVISTLSDTPGIMVGPEVEKTALVRHSSRMFLIGANLSVPFFTVVLRKAYGLGAIAMAGGSFKMPYFSVAWPTGEFGGMGLEGAVKLGYRNELAAIQDPEERRAAYDKMVAIAYQQGKALQLASYFGVDDTIDPADTRRWVGGLLSSIRSNPRSAGKKRPAIDAW